MNLADTIKNMGKKEKLAEAVVVGGGATGVSSVPDPVGGKTPKRMADKEGGEVAMNTIQPDGVNSEEETDADNNTKPTGDMSAQNRASVASKLGISPVAASFNLRAAFEGEDLSEEFMAKAAVIFESAVNERIKLEVTEETKRLEEETKTQLEALVTKLDEYMSYVAGEWMKENKIAIEHGLRTEITEDFISGLKDLFVSHAITVPEDEFSVVEELANELTETEEKLNAAVNENIEMKKALNEKKSQEILASVSEGLTTVDAEKLQNLAEGLIFEDEESYKNKLAILKTTHFSKQASKPVSKFLDESFEGDTAEQPRLTSPSMNKYVDAIARTV